MLAVMAADPGKNGGPRMSETATVLVRGYDDMSQDTLELFLENPKHCGGGPVSDITMDTETDVATVTFEDPDGITVVTILPVFWFK